MKEVCGIGGFDCHWDVWWESTPYHDEHTEKMAGWKATFTANGAVDIHARTINNTPVNPDGSPVGSISSTLPPGTVTPTPPGGAPQKTPGTFKAPTSGLYHIYTDPNRKYLVETDPRFTDYRIFLSSDYFFNMLIGAITKKYDFFLISWRLNT